MRLPRFARNDKRRLLNNLNGDPQHVMTNARSKEKQAIRNEVWEKLAKEGISPRAHGIPPFQGQVEAAQLLRLLDIYQKSQRIFAPPDSAQCPVRVNLLQDEKTLVMATPGLKDGFYEVSKAYVSENLWKAVKSSEVIKYGKK